MNPHESDHPLESQPKEAEISAQKEVILKQILAPNARLRLNNVKMVKPDLAGMVENYLIGMALKEKFALKFQMSSSNRSYFQSNNQNENLRSTVADL